MTDHTSEPTNLYDALNDILDRDYHPLADTLINTVAPIQQLRTALRDNLEANHNITQLRADEKPYYRIAAIDGAYTLNPLYIGDQINTLSIAVRSAYDTEQIDLAGTQANTRFLPHTPTNDTFAKTMMFMGELTLIHDALNHPADAEYVTLIDGSHLTSISALYQALSTGDQNLTHYILDRTDALTDAAAALCAHTHIVGAPKSDSSTHLTEYFADNNITLPDPPLPDKVIATLVLEPGEILTVPNVELNWENYDFLKDLASNATTASFIAAMDAHYQQLKDCGVNISYIKPYGSLTVIKIEHKATLDPFTAADILQAVADDCEPAYTQEPVTQYIVDVLAKQVSDAATLQMAETSQQLATTVTDDDVLSILNRSYRTN